MASKFMHMGYKNQYTNIYIPEHNENTSSEDETYFLEVSLALFHGFDL